MSIKVPLGIEDFAKMREESFYYVDKTAFIRKLLEKQFEASLITRPRRFGKSLTMSMLEDFFDISRDSKAHFDGLAISEEPELCRKWMNQWPVVSLTLKEVEGVNFELAYERFKNLTADMCNRYAFLAASDKVNAADKEIFEKLRVRKVMK